MDNIEPLRDFDDPNFDLSVADELAFGDVPNPYPDLHALAARGAVQEGDLRKMWGLAADGTAGGERLYLVFGYNEVREVLTNAEAFSNDYYKPGLSQTLGPLSLSVLNPPEHTRYRRIFQRAFLPQVVGSWTEEYIDPVVRELVDRFADRGSCDLMGDFVRPYPFEIIYRQLQLPTGQAQIFHKLSVALLRYFIDLPHGIEASEKLGTYFQAAIDQRRRNPGTDLISVLATVDVDGERLPDDVVITFLRQLINAAGDTTYRTTGNMLVGLLFHRPDQLDMLKADRSLIAKAIEETLRWEGPTNVLYRSVTRDVELGGVSIPAGSTVQILTGMANRDSALFAEPDHFDLARATPRPQMTFAAGPHICLGQHLARLEMTRAMNILLDRLPTLRLDSRHPPPEIRGNMLRSPQHIYVRFD